MTPKRDTRRGHGGEVGGHFQHRQNQTDIIRHRK